MAAAGAASCCGDGRVLCRAIRGCEGAVVPGETSRRGCPPRINPKRIRDVGFPPSVQRQRTVSVAPSRVDRSSGSFGGTFPVELPPTLTRLPEHIMSQFDRYALDLKHNNLLHFHQCSCHLSSNSCLVFGFKQSIFEELDLGGIVWQIMDLFPRDCVILPVHLASWQSNSP